MTNPLGRGKYSKQLREADDAFRALASQCDRALVEKDTTIERLRKALADIIAANKDFRAGMPKDCDGDPLQDACDAAAKLLSVNRMGVNSHD